jgi:hypothetical protein
MWAVHRDAPDVAAGRTNGLSRLRRGSGQALVAAPSLGAMSTASRAAHATNEAQRGGAKGKPLAGAGCGCCSPVKLPTSNAIKQPSGRPWMISH